MTGNQITPALSHESLYGKSKIYIGRALVAKNRKSIDEYQLWASLALELLGKSTLAEVHPCLIADPNSSPSVFAAAGMNIGTDLKTITAKTLFDRLGHISKRFDKKIQAFCEDMSVKRNAELHSGELPFEASVLATWEGRYWHTAEIILEAKGETIESWLGADQARAPKELLADYTHATLQAAKVRIEAAGERFSKLSKKERDAAHERAQLLTTWEARRSFRLMPHSVWETTCPACSSKAFLAGIQYTEEVSEEQDDEYPHEETIDVFYNAEEFQCPSCGLHLDSRDEIEAADIDVGYMETEIRQREYEPDYGND